MSKRSLFQMEETQDSGEIYSYEESSDYTYDAPDAQVYFSEPEDIVDAYQLQWFLMNGEERMADINTYRGLQGIHCYIENEFYVDTL
uniref:Uncharacterized protein n=2 Tax=Cruciviridae sp. TaxID=1955495 RepID=A0A1S6LVK8_9VIRU|nr:hypothetical protein [Cruciviridae sp.]